QEWHTLPDDGYIHAHLIWHMEQAGWHDEIHTFEFITIYGLCYTVSPMKGGTHPGLLTVHQSAVPPHGVSGCDQLDPRRVSAPGSTLRGGVPRAYGDVAPR